MTTWTTACPEHPNSVGCHGGGPGRKGASRPRRRKNLDRGGRGGFPRGGDRTETWQTPRGGEARGGEAANDENTAFLD